ncbi:polysaccharide pyruvyl transferase family protein [Aurantiacibacter aquimixticola]|uniref:Polysaccharide pyruvyl transferase family protein n=1 Tax=Aurantiacibacter aquimixticola TaxID=1958945 RepID=A0A419RUN0_9SPHN|nr:polysaccharide pyruvyl transferase family protein [Aurantiacibacter aquimixticola]RJY09454.1 polysaccharide pyruvyl transferase family protein [Aurantiacibacter aquimixticola]
MVAAALGRPGYRHGMTRVPSKQRHIGLLFHSFESENLGVGAFTVANSRMIGEAVERHGGSPVFHVLGMRGRLDYSDSCPWQTDFTNIGTKALANPRSDFHSMLRKCDAFFDIGAGDSFSDIYQASRFSRIVAAKILAARTGKPFLLSPQTIGPFSTWWGKAGAKMALRGADRIFARDELSRDASRDLGYGAKTSLSTDLAFALPYDPPEDKGKLGKWVGINVSGLLFDLSGEGTGRVSLALDYQSLTRRMIDRLLNEPQVEKVFLVPHVTAPSLARDDDGAVSDLLHREFPGLHRAPAFESPSTAKSFIAGLDLLIGARMHATIAAISSDIAVLPLAYSRKFNGLYGSLDYPFLADMVNAGENSSLDKLDDVLGRLDEVTAAAKRSNTVAQEKLAEYTGFIDRFAARIMAA